MLLDDNIILVLIGARVAINLQLRLQDLKVIERQNRVIGREIGSWGEGGRCDTQRLALCLKICTINKYLLRFQCVKLKPTSIT